MFVTTNGIAVESPINVNIIFRLVKSNFVGSSDFKKLMAWNNYANYILCIQQMN